jgi:hypothetical protein
MVGLSLPRVAWWALVVVLLGLAAAAQDALFAPAPTAAALAARAARQQAVLRLAHPAWQRGPAVGSPTSLRLNLLPDFAPAVALRPGVAGQRGGQVYVGELAPPARGHALLRLAGGRLTGYVDDHVGNRRIVIESLAAGLCRAYEVEPQPLTCANAMAPVAPASADAAVAPAALPAAGTQIDVMVVYTPAARTWAGGVEAIENDILTALDSANQVLANSQIDLSYRLVHLQEVQHTERPATDTEPGIFQDLRALTERNDNMLDEVHDLRTASGADLVCLMANITEPYGGIAWLTKPAAGSRPYGFSVVNIRAATTSYSFVHELGHNLGCAHNREDLKGTTGAFAYSYGYYFQATNDNQWYRTVMSYDIPVTSPPDTPHRTQIPYFSHPDLAYQGSPIGVPLNADLPCHNALSISQTMAAAAAYYAALPLNETPVANSDAYSIVENRPRTVAKTSGVLVNDTDADGDKLTAILVTPPAHGTLTLAADGSFTYTPTADFVGEDSFVYTCRDRLNATSQATVTLDVRAQINLIYYQAKLAATVQGGGATTKLKRSQTVVFLQQGGELVPQWAIEYWKDATGAWYRELPEAAAALALLDLGPGLAGMHWYQPAEAQGDAWGATGKTAVVPIGNGFTQNLPKTLKGAMLTYDVAGLAAGQGTISLKFDSKATLASNAIAQTGEEAKAKRIADLAALGYAPAD